VGSLIGTGVPDQGFAMNHIGFMAFVMNHVGFMTFATAHNSALCAILIGVFNWQGPLRCDQKREYLRTPSFLTPTILKCLSYTLLQEVGV
jgi:hypothetical protein